MSTETKKSKACQKANHVCDKTQYKEAFFWEKIKLTIHLAYCKACKNYTKNNQRLTKTIQDANIDCMNIKEKKILKENLTIVIKEYQN